MRALLDTVRFGGRSRQIFLGGLDDIRVEGGYGFAGQNTVASA